MKKYLLFLSLIFVITVFTRCGKGDLGEPVTSPEGNNAASNSPTGSKIKITVGSSVFTATLYTNPSATAFRAMLPLTLNMDDLNANEKFYYFSSTLPTTATVGGNIQEGDLMLYGNNCLVLFYKGFNTTFSYSRLGKVDNIAGYTAALGAGTVSVRFETQ